MLRSSDRKTKYSKKYGLCNQTKNKNEMKYILYEDKTITKHLPSKNKILNKINDHINESNINLQPLIVLYHRKKKNLKKDSDEMICFKEPSKRLKTNSEKVKDYKLSLRNKNQLGNKVYKEDENISTQENHLIQREKPFIKLTLNSEEKEIIKHNSNNKNPQHKQKIKQNNGLVCINSIAQLGAKKRKKRSITNQQVVKGIIKGTSTLDKCFLTENILNKIKSQSIKSDENHLVFITPSQIEKLLKYVRNPNKYNSCLNESIINMFLPKSSLSIGGNCNSFLSKNILRKLNVHKPLKTLSEITVLKKDITRCNPTHDGCNPQEGFKHVFKKGTKKNTFKLHLHNQIYNNYSKSQSKYLKRHQRRNKSFKHDLVREYESYGAISNTSKNTKHGFISHKNPKLSPIFSETLTVKPKGKEFVYSEFLPHKSRHSVKPTGVQLKCKQPSLLKHYRKPHDLKELFNNTILTEISSNKEENTVFLQNCKENTSPEEIKELKKGWSKTDVPKANTRINTIENCLSLQNDQVVCSNESSIPLNNFVFSSEQMNSLNTTKSNKKLLKVLRSNEERLSKKCKETDTKIEMVADENSSGNTRFLNSSKVQVKDAETRTDSLERTEQNRIKYNSFVFLPKERDVVYNSNKQNTSNNEKLSIPEERIDNSSNSLLKLTNKGNLSEVGIQTDMEEAVGIDIKEDLKSSAENESEIRVFKYPPNINKSILHINKNEAEMPINRKSFVRIVGDEDQQSKGSHYIDEGGNNIENKRTNFNLQTLQFVTNESDKDKNQIVHNTNAVYESLQMYLNVMRDHRFTRLHGGCESPCEIEQFNNLRQCLCNNCLEILNQTDLDASKTKNKKPTNHNNTIQKSSNFSVDNTAINKINQFVSINEDDVFKIGSEKINYPSINLISNKTRKIEINSDYSSKKLSQEDSPNNKSHYTFENKTETDLNNRLKCLENDKKIKLLGSVLPHSNNQTIINSDRTSVFVKKVGTKLSYKNQLCPDDNQGKGHNILIDTFKCPSVKKDNIIKCDKGSYGKWLMPEALSVEKKPLFVEIVDKGCDKRVENNQTPDIEPLKYSLFCPDVSNQSVNNDREPFYVVVPSQQTNTEVVKIGNTHQNMDILKESGDGIECKTSEVQSTAVYNLVGDSKLHTVNLYKKDNDINNCKSIPCKAKSSNNSFKCIFEPYLNGEPLQNCVRFANNDKEVGSKGTQEENKHLNKTTSELSVLNKNTKGHQYEPHKVCSTDIPITHYDENNTIPIEEQGCMKKKVSPLQEEKSNISIVIFFSDSESKTSFNQNVSSEEGTEHSIKKLNIVQMDNNLREIRNEFNASNEISEVQDELNDTEEWICLNKYDFHNTSLHNKKENDTKEKKIGFQMNIKMSDMHVKFFCQPPDLNYMEENISVNKTIGNS